MSCGSAADQTSEYFAQFGTKSLAILGFSPEELSFHTRESSRQQQLMDLQDEYQDIINTSFLAYAQQSNWDLINDDFQDYIATSNAFMNNSNLTLTVQLKSQQILLIGVYLLFFIIYFYLIFFT
ncbi:MAG: hypothetical protein CMM15_10790 [Rhodospirillaceae bacterium]|nr:hypothetical protein [Rhodospirillaceae bacterium]OUX67840.1 MAG: hypothetical protein CBD38_01045 [bacterium TMED178]|tara:strand:+ start:1034 stop:1405 length:372 start_codon:yes stop_codon:yes gene_type:complete